MNVIITRKVTILFNLVQRDKYQSVLRFCTCTVLSTKEIPGNQVANIKGIQFLESQEKLVCKIFKHEMKTKLKQKTDKA